MTFTDFIKKVVEAFQLDANLVQIPDRVGSVILPTFQVNIPVPIIRNVSDSLLNDSNKTLTVPEGKQWKILYGAILLTTNVTVGDRQFEIKIKNASADITYILRSAAIQAASLTEQYTLGQFGDVAQTVDGRHTIPIPVNCILDENFQIQILDAAAIAPTADDLIISLIVEESDMVKGSTVNTAL